MIRKIKGGKVNPDKEKINADVAVSYLTTLVLKLNSCVYICVCWDGSSKIIQPSLQSLTPVVLSWTETMKIFGYNPVVSKL